MGDTRARETRRTPRPPPSSRRPTRLGPTTSYADPTARRPRRRARARPVRAAAPRARAGTVLPRRPVQAFGTALLARFRLGLDRPPDHPDEVDERDLQDEHHEDQLPHGEVGFYGTAGWIGCRRTVNRACSSRSP